MDLDRLSLDEIALMSKVIEILGIPQDPNGLMSVGRMLEALSTKYQALSIQLSQTTRAHGE